MSRFTESMNALWQSIGLFILRVGIGTMLLVGHGWGKLTGFNDMAENFDDPFGIGPGLSLALVVFAEVVCAAAVVVGLLTRVVVIPLVINFAVAAFWFHAADPWFLGAGAAKEPALLYLLPFLTLFFTGPGRFSIDALIFSRRKTPAT